MSAPKKKRLRKPGARKAPEKKLDLERVEKRLAAAEAAIDPASKGSYVVRSSEVRQTAAVDYITDPESRSVDYWWRRTDRPYSRMVKLDTFREWATSDNWKSRRDRYWSEIEDRVIETKKHQMLIQRLKEVEELTEVRSSMMEYLVPLRDGYGEIRRHTEGDLIGLPMFPLELPPMDKFAAMAINVDKLLMLKRGEATARNEQLGGDRKVASLDPVGAKASFSREDIRHMSRLMLQLRQPELGDLEPIEIHDEVYGDNDGSDDDGDD